MSNVVLTKAQLSALREVATGTVKYHCSPMPLRRSYETWYTSRYAKRTFDTLYKAELIAYAAKLNCAGDSTTLVVVTDKGKELL